MSELRFMFLTDDILIGLVSFDSTVATSSNIYIALPRLSAVFLRVPIWILVLCSCISLLGGR